MEWEHAEWTARGIQTPPQLRSFSHTSSWDLPSRSPYSPPPSSSPFFLFKCCASSHPLRAPPSPRLDASSPLFSALPASQVRSSNANARLFPSHSPKLLGCLVSIIYRVYAGDRLFSSSSSRQADITLTVDGKEVTVPQGLTTPCLIWVFYRSHASCAL